ncbi:MAG TPA: precorrin-8X methylmutase [Candidatus Dormibacteraeota bacterium]|nr:precorrin-8X methylmutase [Candidatus Dormibacteraeota bacterium]
MRGPLTPWPVPGGFLERLGRRPELIEDRSRGLALALAGRRWRGAEADLVAALVYAAGDPSLLDLVRLGGDPVGRARRALARGAPLLVDVRMVAAGIRRRAGRRLAVAVTAPGAGALARRCGTTRAAAGMRLRWDEFGAGGVVAIGNAPTALLALLDLAAARPPACVVATCPGLQLAAAAKSALAASGLSHLVVSGTRGGSGLAAAALNVLLGGVGEPEG